MQVRSCDAGLARGEYRGWMHGFPLAAKNLAATRGIVTTLGSPLLRDFIPAQDAIVVERMRAAGAIIIGKTNVPAFGFGSQTYNPVYGATRNAWDVGRTAGGGGAAHAAGGRRRRHDGIPANPAGFDERGLPMGLQIIGPHHADLAVLQLGRACERAIAQWLARTPALLAKRA